MLNNKFIPYNFKKGVGYVDGVWYDLSGWKKNNPFRIFTEGKIREVMMNKKSWKTSR